MDMHGKADKKAVSRPFTSFTRAHRDRREEIYRITEYVFLKPFSVTSVASSEAGERKMLEFIHGI